MKKVFLKNSIVWLFVFTLSFSFVFKIDAADNSADLEKELQQQLDQYNQEIEKFDGLLNVQKSKIATIQRDVDVLTTEITKAQTSINLKNNIIKTLGQDIELKDKTVSELNAKMDRSMDSLAQLIKKTNEQDSISLTEILLANDRLSDFFVNSDTYFEIRGALENLFDEIREIRGLTEEEKKKLEARQVQERDIKAEIEAEKKQVQVKEAEKKNVLAISKQTEKTYEDLLADRRAKAATIREALFRLRDSAGISFGQALEYANEASRATGVRAAFILAILKQESDLGKNVGTCNRPGDPESKKWYNIMPGPNDGSWRDDQTIFLAITKKLGLDPESTPLSCPIGNGWGGAMGPSQFIPYTWNAYDSRIASALGISTPNPWNPEHAFTATALYVKDLGAAAGGYTAEKTAALKYYAGNNWSLPQNQFYGNQVMAHATEFQEQIDFLKDVDSQ
ncbi:lytic murein transglycosylase [Candidatus Nomurabacteria bacterium]|nr:lytic murein transglycosylase [Candidatus Nomurabacteria bacterium]